MFVKLTTMAGLVAYFNISRIKFFFDNDLYGCIVKFIDADAESVQETADEVAALIQAAKDL